MSILNFISNFVLISAKKFLCKEIHFIFVIFLQMKKLSTCTAEIAGLFLILFVYYDKRYIFMHARYTILNMFYYDGYIFTTLLYLKNL
jgi:hypothetical protein